ncbi:MAG: dTDP-4-dehydrorhamnose reductase [bacterium]
MKWLIIGAKGNLGSQLVKVAADNELTVWDWPEIDLKDSVALRQQLFTLQPEVIINAATYNAVDKCETDAVELELAYQLNRKLVDNLAQAALELGAVFVHYSTDYVFAGDQPQGYREDDRPQPINRYGQTKLAGEEEILSRQGQLKYYLIRTSKLFGPQGTGEFCKPSFFDLMLEKGRQQPEVAVVDEEVSCFTYTKDLATVTKQLIMDRATYGIYHVVNVGPCTWYQATKHLFDISGISAKVKAITAKDYPRPAPRPKFSVLQNTKLPALRSWQEALKDYLRN